MYRVRTVRDDLQLAGGAWLGYGALAILISCLASLSLPPSANGVQRLGHTGLIGLLLGFGVAMALVGVWSARMSWAASLFPRLANAELQPDGTPPFRSRWPLLPILYGGVLLVGSVAYFAVFHLPLTANMQSYLFVFVGMHWLLLARRIRTYEHEWHRRYFWQRAPRWALGRWRVVYLPAE